MTKVTLSVNEVAEVIGVSPACIYTMVREGQIPHRKVRARILFHRETIESWLRGDAPKQKEA
jgi:excisionase family DNA binding protein